MREPNMSSRWMTLQDIAESRSISLDQARRWVDAVHCPRVFRAETTLYLV
jgi:hypothetical protein